MWEENTSTSISKGIGIYLSSGQGDYKFNNVIISYCKEYGIHINSTANFFTNFHVYGCGIRNEGTNNYFENCYFSKTFETLGYFTIVNSFFSMEKADPIIVPIEMSDNLWRISYSKVVNNIFRSNKSDTILYDATIPVVYRPYTVGNTFQNVKIVTNKGNPLVYGNPFNTEIQKTYDKELVKSINLGNFVIYYGSSSENVTINFQYALTEVYFQGCTAIDTTTPCAIRADTISAIIKTTSLCTWFVIGRIN